MKKIFTLIAAGLLSGGLFAQIPNPGFETWTSGNPDGWLTSNAPGIYTPVTQTTDAHSGASAARGEIVDFFGSAVPPLLYVANGGGGFPVTQDYTNLNGWFKAGVQNNDVVQIIIAAYDAANNPVGGGSELFSNASSYQPFSIPIFTNGTPTASYQIFFSISDTSGATDGTIGSYFIVDDLELTSSTDVRDQSAPEQLKVFPNPAREYLFYVPSATLRGQVNAQLIDLQGKSVFAENFEASGTPQARRLDLTGIAPGFYLLRLLNGASTEVVKVVVK
jgi:hypothetical protein